MAMIGGSGIIMFNPDPLTDDFVIARAKRISSDLDKFSKKCSSLKRIHLPLILFSGSKSCSLDPHTSTICCGSVSKNTSHFTFYPLSFEYEDLTSS